MRALRMSPLCANGSVVRSFAICPRNPPYSPSTAYLSQKGKISSRNSRSTRFRKSSTNLRLSSSALQDSCSFLSSGMSAALHRRRSLLFCRRGGELMQDLDKCSRGARQSAVAPVGQAQFAEKLHILKIDQLDSPSCHFIAGERSADERHAKIGGHKALDHANTGQFHSHF